MKKALALILALTLCVGFTGCSKEKEPEKVSSASSLASGPSVFVGAGGNKTSSKDTATSSSASQKDDSSKQESSSSKPQSSSSSNKSSSSKKTSSTESSSSVYKDPIPANAPRIICWGDSITQGMGMGGVDDYPSVLQTLIGNKYRVLNAGSPGEKSQTIAARQGAYTVTLDRDLVFKAGYGSVYLDGVNGPNLIIDDGSILDIDQNGEGFRNDLPSNIVYIDGKKYELAANGKCIEILREDYDKKLVIKKGAKVVFESAKKQQGSYCEIFYVGANDGNVDVDVLVNRYKAMAKRQGSDRYIVIIPQWTHKYTEALKAEFGNKAIDLRAEMCSIDAEKEFGYYVSAEDKNRMQSGYLPLMYLYNNDPSESLHLSVYGYNVMANIIYKHGKALGYWK